MTLQKNSKSIYVTRPLLPSLSKITKRLEAVWKSGQVTNNGDAHKQLKEQLKQYLEVENLSLFANGTMALIAGIKSLNLTGEVITTPFTFPATVEALEWNGLTPVFCDIEPRSLTIDVSKIEALITDKTSAILAVHVFGNPCDVEALDRIAKKHNVKVIYDGAHAFGMYVNGKPIGQYGDMTMFSFHATKLFQTIEGGALTYRSQSTEETLSQIKNFGLNDDGEVVLNGLNGKLNEMQAVVGIETLLLVPEERKKRQQIKEWYEQQLLSVPGIRILTLAEESYSSYQYFAIEIDENIYGMSRDALLEELAKENIFARKYFYPLCSSFRWYRDLLSAKTEQLPYANAAVKRVLVLPFYGDLAQEDIFRICNILKESCHAQVGERL